MYKFLFFVIALSLSCAAAPPAAEQQARALQTVLQQADEAYYNRHESMMSDAAYDAMRSQYDRLVADYPELADESSVGAPTESRRVPHDSPVISLKKTYSNEGVRDFMERCGTNLLFCVEPKLDGLTVVLHYRNGLLVQALTRGDGKTGRDVTSAVLASGAVPLRLIHAPAKLDVRGEMILPHPAFEKLNLRRIANGESALKSPRNTASGTLTLNDFSEIANRGLQFQCFELLKTDSPPATHTESLALIKKSGLPVVESKIVPASDVLETIADLNQRREAFPFGTDGVVIKVNDVVVCDRLGATAHHPRSAIARKYKEVPIPTRLLAVEWTRGESGKLTPVAIFVPVELQGATLQRATLHNLGYIRAMDLKIGDWIHVIRAGGSVPEIIGILPDRRDGSETEIHAPGE
jgi:DNA ligase (NAD+)